MRADLVPRGTRHGFVGDRGRRSTRRRNGRCQRESMLPLFTEALLRRMPAMKRSPAIHGVEAAALEGRPPRTRCRGGRGRWQVGALAGAPDPGRVVCGMG